MIAMIGTSDRLCWLAETCKILLLLLYVQNATGVAAICFAARLSLCVQVAHRAALLFFSDT